jgi:hypothetical protein
VRLRCKESKTAQFDSIFQHKYLSHIGIPQIIGVEGMFSCAEEERGR